MDYSNGKIYKILNEIDDSCYVGSTIQPLSKIMAWHRDALRNTQMKHRLLYTKMNEYGVDNFFIELIEDYPCESVEQLRKREGEYIRELGTLNKRIEGRSKKEYNQLYNQEHKEHLSEIKKGYRVVNRDHILETRRDLRLRNIDTRREQDKEYYNHRKEVIHANSKEWKSTKVVCDCGGSYTNAHKAEHYKSKKHTSFMEPNILEV